ncbi:MAG TPA: universal stress protein [Acidobacteriaceae bacterium]|nr:universal stress protein [Acidobacteriaceae bacterium]
MTLQSDRINDFADPGRIAVATDLTDTDYLLPYAISQARASRASLILIHAVLPHESSPMEDGASAYYDPLRMDRDARLMLEGLARNARDQGIECATAVRHGFVPDVISEVVRNSGAGRLILGTHGRRGLKKFVLGSVARQLLEAIEVPVCTVGPRAHKSTMIQPETILHPVSLSGMHEASAALAFGLGRQFGAQVVLLHVLPPAPSSARDPGQTTAAATEQLNRMIPADAVSWTRAEVRAAHGTMVAEILAAAEESRAGLIVLGVHAPAHSWLPGTEPAAYKILVSAPCPVLSLRVNPSALAPEAEHEREASPVSG